MRAISTRWRANDGDEGGSNGYTDNVGNGHGNKAGR